MTSRETYIISPAVAEDAPALTLLVNAAYRGEESRQGWTTEADLLDGTRIDLAAMQELIATPGTTVLKYLDNGIITGCVELKKTGNKLYLGMLSVKPFTQGKGIGKQLLQAAEAFAINNGCTIIYMTVISSRSELISWYVRHGYQLTGERKPFEVPDSRWGIPRQELEFAVLEKKLIL